MGRKKGKSNIYDFLEKLETHFEYLLKIKKIDQPTRKAFFEQFLGCSPTIYTNWYTFGIKKIYFSILFLLDEIKKQKERIEILEKQLNEITKK